MLKIYDQYKNFVGHLEKYKDLKTVEEIGVPDSQMSFVLMDPSFQIRPEWYVVTEDAEYVVKETPYTTGSYPTITCVLNLEDWATPYEVIQVTQTTIAAAVAQILPAGWSIGSSTVTKERNAGMMHVTALEALQKLCTAFMCEMTIDTVAKTVSFAPTIGQDRGAYFMSGLNLKKLTAKRSSYDYYTRIIPIGKNGLNITTVNNGLNYLENYQYSDKILAYIWKNEDYDNAQALKDDAELYLDDLSKPEVSYSAEIRDLAAQSDTYSALDFALGDTITLVDLESGTREKQRIKKITRYPGSPEKNTCEIGNTMLTFEEMQDKVRQSSEIVNYLVSSTGTYSGTITVSGILGFEAGVAATSVVTQMQTDITTAAQAAALAQTTADGKNQVLYATVPPVGSDLVENDIWFDTDDGNKMYRWTGSAWEAKQFDTAALAAECIDTAHLAAGAVTAAKIAAGTITADKIDVSDLFAQNITATGTISGATLTGTNLTADEGNIGGFTIKRGDSYCYNKTTANEGHCFATSLFIHNSGSGYEYEAGMKGDSGGPNNIAFYVKRMTEGDTWSNAEYIFNVNNSGKLYAMDANIKGTINATSFTASYSSGNLTMTATLGGSGLLLKSAITGGATKYLALDPSTTIWSTTASASSATQCAYASNTGFFVSTSGVKADGSARANIMATEISQYDASGNHGTYIHGASVDVLNSTSSGRGGRLTSSDSGNIGLWDVDEENYIIYSGTDFNVRIPHPTSLTSVETYDGYYKPIGSYGTDGRRVAYVSARVDGSNYQFRVSGQWGATGSNYSVKTIWSASTSDIRLKENVKPSTVDALALVEQMQVREFDWKRDGKHQGIGFVADELEQLDPDLALGGGYDEDGNMDEKQVNTYQLAVYLAKAVQQLKAEIDTLKRGA